MQDRCKKPWQWGAVLAGSVITAQGAVQAEPADSVKSTGATVDTGDSSRARRLGDNFCSVTSSYDNAHPYCARAFVHIRSSMHIHHFGSEVWLQGLRDSPFTHCKHICASITLPLPGIRLLIFIRFSLKAIHSTLTLFILHLFPHSV